VQLSWDPSTSIVAGYNVYRGTTSGGPYTKMNSSLVTILSFEDNTVQGGQTYVFMVRAVDSRNVESAPSNEIAVSIPSP
jgi:fibronectin type 3 domain-containing protein